MECKRRRCQYSTSQVTKISAVSVWPLLSPGPAENSAEYWRQENSLPFPSPIWRGLFQGVFNSYTSKLYFKLIWQLHVIPRAERLSLSQEGELHNQRCAWGGDAGRASKMPCRLLQGDSNGQKLESLFWRNAAVWEKQIYRCRLEAREWLPDVLRFLYSPVSVFPLHTP